MSKLKIRIHPDPILKQKAAPVTDFGAVMQELFDNMIETMYAADGVGIAAPQIGVSRQIFIACPTMRRGEVFVMVNPVIESASGKEPGSEGCLSLPGVSAEVFRATKVKIRYYDRHGKQFRVETENFFARVVQHEMDHLNGKLLIDHFAGAKRLELLAQFEAAQKNPSKNVKRNGIVAKYGEAQNSKNI